MTNRDFDDELDELEHLWSLRMPREFRVRLVRASMESEAAGRDMPQGEIEAWIEATINGPMDDHVLVTLIEDQIRDLTRTQLRALGALRTTAQTGEALRGLVELWQARTQPATATRKAKRERMVRRARALKAEGKSTAQIALAMSAERGKETATRTVERWLADKKVPTDRRSVGPTDELSG